jgi:hypothetical protein
MIDKTPSDDQLDKQKNNTPEPKPEMTGRTLFDFLSSLLDKRSPTDIFILILILLIIPLLGVAGAAYISWIIWSPQVEISSVGLSVKANFFSPKITTLLIHPRGWQNTGIKVSPGDKIFVRVTGETNIGPDIASIFNNLKDPISKKLDFRNKKGWPWVGAQGISPTELKALDKNPPKPSKDPSLITSEHEYGRLIGYVTKEDNFPKKFRMAENELKKIPVANEKVRNHCILEGIKLPEIDEEFEFNKKHIVDFGKNVVPEGGRTDGTIEIPQDQGILKNSYLYLAINDSTCPEWQYDNFGILMVSIKHP